MLLLLAAGCSEPEPSKSTFMGLTEGTRQQVNRPQGLNPLGDLPVCQPGEPAQALGERVLVARPDWFTREASLMISALRQALADEYGEKRTIDFVITNTPIQTGPEAVAEGQHCGALIVFWEPFGSRN
ncbi:MAG TPA: hypothetical protein VL359_12135, partial [bacterium]|nr:hypothetical protein [bacterium]